jgi:hypothetical protein
VSTEGPIILWLTSAKNLENLPRHTVVFDNLLPVDMLSKHVRPHQPVVQLFRGSRVGYFIPLDMRVHLSTTDRTRAVLCRSQNRTTKGADADREREYCLVPGTLHTISNSNGPTKTNSNFQSKWIAIFQLPVVTFVVAVATDITQAAGVYCEFSTSSKPMMFAHFWVSFHLWTCITLG